jgi:hypothetical protein
VAGVPAEPSAGRLRVRFATLLAPNPRRRFAARPRDVALLLDRARVRCGGRTLAGVPLLGSRRLRFAVLPRCRGGIAVRGGKALVVRRDSAARTLDVGWGGATVRAAVRGGGLRDVRIETRVGGRWRPLPRSGRALLPLSPAGARVPVRASGVDAHGRRHVATAQLAR